MESDPVHDEIEALKGKIDGLAQALLVALALLDGLGYGNAMHEGIRRSRLTSSSPAPQGTRDEARDRMFNAVFGSILDDGEASREHDDDSS